MLGCYPTNTTQRTLLRRHADWRLQVFDKALTEPTFCQLYATLCQDLNRELPQEFEPDAAQAASAGDGKPAKNNFRYILLNKCQVEFEKGIGAKEAMESRERSTGTSAVSAALLPAGALSFTALDDR